MGKAENDPLGVLGTPGDIAPVASLPPQGVKEQRNETRYMASWRIAVAIEGQDFHYGRIKDVSPHGTEILNVLNLKPGTRVTLNIHIPTLSTPCKPKTLIVHGVLIRLLPFSIKGKISAHANGHSPTRRTPFPAITARVPAAIS